MNRPEFLPPVTGHPPAGPVRTEEPEPVGMPPDGDRPAEDTPAVTFSEAAYRLHGATVVLRGVGIIVVTIGIFLPLIHDEAFLITGFTLLMFPYSGAVFGVAALAWSRVRFWVHDENLVYQSGVLRRASRQIPLRRLQGVDVIRPLVPRMFGLAEVRIELAAGDRSELRFSYLARPMAERLRAALLAYAAGLHGGTPEATERRVHRVRMRDLLAGLLLRVPVMAGLALCLFLGLVWAMTKESGVAGGLAPAMLVLGREVGWPLVAWGRFTVSSSPDGLRLRSGLLVSRMRTVPPGRVHAVHIEQPVLWRAFGWVKVEVTVTGYGDGRDSAGVTLLPIAHRDVAYELVDLVFPDASLGTVELVAVSPGRFDHGGSGANDVVFVSRHGWPGRTIDVVAHERAQSVQLVAGPWQRARGRATVYLDTPSGPGRAALVLPVRQARMLVEQQVARGRLAEHRERPHSSQWQDEPAP